MGKNVKIEINLAELLQAYEESKLLMERVPERADQWTVEDRCSYNIHHFFSRMFR